MALPRDQLVVITGLSGSGKSSLAFDTLYAEGQRRYVESLSAYARQFLGQMDKPDVDSIEGLSPAISIDQKTTTRNPRSTVGTVTEIYDYLRLLYARVGHPHCPKCGREISGQIGGADRGAGPGPARGHPLHHRRAGGARAQGRVQGALRPAASGRLHPHSGRRRATAAGGSDRPRQADPAHDLGGRRPAGHEGGAADAPDRLGGDCSSASRGAGRGGRGGGRDPHLLREVRLPGRRHLAARAGTADLLLQLAARRLPALHRPRHAARDRPRAGRARSNALHLGGRAGALDGHQRELLRADAPGDRRPLRD